MDESIYKKIYQNLNNLNTSSENMEKKSFLSLCNDESKRKLDEKHLQVLKCFSKPGKSNLYFLLQLVLFL